MMPLSSSFLMRFRTMSTVLECFLAISTTLSREFRKSSFRICFSIGSRS